MLVVGFTEVVLVVAPPGLHDQVVALGLVALNVVLEPEQIFAGDAETFRVGVAVTVTVTAVAAEHPPLKPIKVYVVLDTGFTTMELLVEPDGCHE